MRSTALPTTILHESGRSDLCISGNNIDPSDSTIDTPTSLTLADDLVFKTTTANSKSSFWLVTDRQTEWYKLRIPVHLPTNNPEDRIVPFKTLPSTARKKKLKTEMNSGITRPAYVEDFIVVRGLFKRKRRYETRFEAWRELSFTDLYCCDRDRSISVLFSQRPPE